MDLSIGELTPHFGGEVSGIDLKSPINHETAAAIEAAMDRYAVLVFRGQHLDEDAQKAFGGWFGPANDPVLRKVLQAKSRFKHEEFIDISNVDLAGNVVSREDRRLTTHFANQLWHSDASFQYPAAKYSMLAAQVIPKSGSVTEFADLRAAYDALPEATKAELEGLIAEHSMLHSRLMLDDTQYTEQEKARVPPVQWPIVRVHAGSKRKSLFLGAHAERIVGWTVPEGRMMLADLLEHATQREFVYSHQWQVGDLVMYDNRCTVHRGRRYDLSARRELRRYTTDDVPT